MKKLITVIFIAMLSLAAFSQHDTTEDSVKVFINCKDTADIEIMCRDSAKIRCFPTPIIDSGMVIVASRHICLEAYVGSGYYLTKCGMYINEMYFITEVPSNIKFNEELQKSADAATIEYFNSESWINELKQVKPLK